MVLLNPGGRPAAELGIHEDLELRRKTSSPRVAVAPRSGSFKTRALIDAGAGQPQIFIDDYHLLLGPAQQASPIGQSVLASSGLAIMLDLARRGLANVN